MIIVKLIGGLGNQMFQYAAAKALACRHRTEVKVDLSYLEADPGHKHIKREFELHVFETDIKSATPLDKEPFFKKQQNRFLKVLKGIFSGRSEYKYATENGALYNSQFEKFPENTFLEGFWQSEKYLRGYEKEVREDFTFKPEIQKIAGDWKERMGKGSVSIHVRRGDYVNNAEASKFHGLCSEDYYERAVKYLVKKNSATELFIFSDDLDWCKDHLHFSLPVSYVDLHNAPAEMYLMSECNHNILANSSFSWWAAWLNRHEDKIVIAPDRWFQSEEVKTDDIYCRGWIRM